MKKIFGILCLALACVSGFNLAKSFTTNDTKSSSGSAAYDSGRKVGGFLAPLLMGSLGLWLLTRDDSMTPAPPPPRRSPGTLPPPGDPFLRAA